MGWLEQVDGYCERIGPGYWAEPVNALTNIAFLVAAVVLWRRCGGMTTGRALAAIVFVIGVGSWLFHTHATVWAGAADVLPIMIYIIAYIFVANRDYLRLATWKAGVGAVLVFVLIGLMGRQFAAFDIFGSSAAYVPVPIVIAAYGWVLRRRLPRVARGLWVGGRASGGVADIPHH